MDSQSINKEQKQSFLYNNQLIRLKHNNHQKYLMSANVDIQNLSIFSTQKFYDSFIVGCHQPDLRSLWQVIRFVPSTNADLMPLVQDHEDSQIWYDDFILLRNYANGCFLTMNNSIKSQNVSEQAQVSCQKSQKNDEKQMFMIQRIQDEYAKIRKPEQKLDNRIYQVNNQLVVLMNADNGLALHSHKEKYKQEDALQYHEVTGFGDRDNNDFWEIQLIHQEDLFSSRITDSKIKQQTLNKRIIDYVHNQDKVVIRNSKTGCSLHSHNRNYKNESKKQEVTGKFGLPRDDNDWWTIIIVRNINSNSSVLQSDEKTHEIFDNKIKQRCIIKLQHMNTQKYLTGSKNYKSPSKNGYEVSCQTEDEENEWLLISQNVQIDEDLGDNLITEYPFMIKHLPSNTYLYSSQTPSKPSHYQNEIALVASFEASTVWQIEQKDSIYT